MRFYIIIGFLFLLSFFGFQNLNAQTQKKTTIKKKPPTTVKAVPTVTKSKSSLKTVTKKATMARKQQIKKAVRRSKMTRRSIRRR
jgi:hypothetical protein